MIIGIGTDLCDIRLPTGQPYMLITGGAKARLDALTPSGMVAQVHVSQTDEYPLAHAMVIISAVPAMEGA